MKILILFSLGIILCGRSFAMDAECIKQILQFENFGRSNPLSAQGYVDLAEHAADIELPKPVRLQILNFLEQEGLTIVKVLTLDPHEKSLFMSHLLRMSKLDQDLTIREKASSALNAIEGHAQRARELLHREESLANRDVRRSSNDHLFAILADESIPDPMDEIPLRYNLEPTTPFAFAPPSKSMDGKEYDFFPKPSSKIKSSLELIARIDNDLSTKEQKLLSINKLLIQIEIDSPFPELQNAQYISLLLRLKAIQRSIVKSDDTMDASVSVVVRALSSKRLLSLAETGNGNVADVERVIRNLESELLDEQIP